MILRMMKKMEQLNPISPVKKDAAVVAVPTKETHTTISHEKEKVGSEICKIVYHVIEGSNGADGGYHESHFETSDKSSELAYITMKKFMTDIKRDQLEIAAAFSDVKFNRRASNAVEVG